VLFEKVRTKEKFELEIQNLSKEPFLDREEIEYIRQRRN
jgi:hypothetical protein